MKLACASGAVGRAIESGALTQLEFLDICARELECDGVVLDVRHFPRTDHDYLAQVKKMAVDRGLTIAALFDPDFFSSPEAQMDALLTQVDALGAPLLAAPLAPETAFSWNDQLERIGTATSLAKARNVTLALRNAPKTFAATTHDCKRVAKEADSAWLRYGPEPGALDPASDPRLLVADTVLLWSDAARDDDRAVAALVEVFGSFRGHLVVDDSGGSATAASLHRAVARLRMALLNRK